MKTKIQSVLCLILAFGIFSCSSDDEGNASVSAEGTWRLTSLEIGTALDLNEDGNLTRDLFLETNCYENDFINFDSDGNVRVVTGLADIYPQINSNGTAWEYVYDCPNGLDVMSTWSQESNTVSVPYGLITLVGTISGDTMTVSIPQFMSWELYVDQNNTTTITENVTLTYVKE